MRDADKDCGATALSLVRGMFQYFYQSIICVKEASFTFPLTPQESYRGVSNPNANSAAYLSRGTI